MPAFLLWLGIVAITLGAAGSAGALWRRLSQRPARRADWLPAAYATACAFGGSILILATPGWSALARWLAVAAVVMAALAALRRPGWLPQAMWRRACGRGYLAGAMALAAAWGLSQALARPSPAPLLIALSAVCAGAASSGTALGSDRSA